MKSIAIILLAFALGTTGCATNGELTEEQRIGQIANVAELAASTGTRVTLSEKPEWEPHFRTALAVLNTLIADENYDPDALRKALQNLPVKELRSELGAILTDAVIVVYDTYGKDRVDLDEVKYLKPIMVAMRDGIERGLLSR